MCTSHHPLRSLLPLLAVLGTLACSAAPALAATNNLYKSQFNGEATAAKSFYPGALALNGIGDIYVADAEHRVIDELNPSGTAVEHEFTGDGTPAEGFYPEGLAVNSSGDVFVAAPERAVVYEFESSGALLREITGALTAAKSFAPYAVAVNASGDVYIADAEHEVVDEFNSTGTAVEHEFSGAATAHKSFVPIELAIGPAGEVYVSDEAHHVVDEFNATGTELLGEITGTTTPQESFFPYKLAVSAGGEVYVDDLAHKLVDRFSSTGTYLSQFNGAGTPQGSFSPSALAVNTSGQVYVGDGANDVVDIFGPPEAEPVEGQWVTESATSVMTTTATLNGTVDPEGGKVTACEFEYGTSTSYGHTAACEQTSSQIGEGTSAVAVSTEVSGLEPGTKYYFRVTGEGVKGAGHGDEETFTTLANPPMATIKPVTGISAHCATFNGEVDPEGFATTYQFEDSTNGTIWTPLGSANAGAGKSDTAASQVACGLLGSSTYHVRLRAENSGGHVISGEESFATPASGPQLAGVDASVLDGGEATLYATIYPEGQTTTYRFEYGPSTTYGTTIPTGEGDAGSVPSQVSQAITGLEPGMTYHFRIVAVNATGTTYGADKTFTTSLIAPVAVPGACANEALRRESNIDPSTGVPYSTHLPDCRAYEQVTPPFKAGDGVADGRYKLLLGDTTAVENISARGTPLWVRSFVQLDGVTAGTDFESNPTSYELARTSSGWATTGLTPAATEFPTATEELASEEDAAAGLWSAATPEQSVYAEDFYRHEASGKFVNIGPVAPPSTTVGPAHGPDPVTLGVSVGRDQLVGASADLRDVMFQLDSAAGGGEQSYLWPGDKTVSDFHPSLYEYVGTGHSGEGAQVPALVGVDNSGRQISQCGTGLGPDIPSKAGEIHAFSVVHNGISAGGSTAFFTAQAGGCTSGAVGPATNQVYARIGAPGDAQATVNVAGTSGCANSTSCNVTSAVTYQGASHDGSRIFFTAAQAGLVAGDTDATNALYECELPGDGGATPTPTGVVNACPDLKTISSAPAGDSAELQSLVAISEEGSRVYFIAKGKLTSEPDSSLPAGQQFAIEGEDNLYVWEAHGDGEEGRTAFVATVPTAALIGPQATPDGKYLVFTTTADLTAGDTSTAAQAFRYDASTGELIRVSVGQNGFNGGGNTNTDPAILASTKVVSGSLEAFPQYRTVSENGAYVVFQSSAALTPEVKGGVNNVYDWHEGTVSLLSDGADTSERGGLIGMDATGENIFFVTADKLVGQDTDEDYDVYDARIDGGFPAPTPEPSCSGEACQGPLSSPGTSSPLISSAGLPAIGNLAPPKAKPAAPPAKPAIAKHSVKGSTITLSVKVTGVGSISAAGSGLKTLKKVVTKAGTYSLKLTLTKADMASLRKHHRLKLRIKVSFAPSSGAASSTTITITVRR